jgi:hypothetical protein
MIQKTPEVKVAGNCGGLINSTGSLTRNSTILPENRQNTLPLAGLVSTFQARHSHPAPPGPAILPRPVMVFVLWNGWKPN